MKVCGKKHEKERGLVLLVDGDIRVLYKNDIVRVHHYNFTVNSVEACSPDQPLCGLVLSPNNVAEYIVDVGDDVIKMDNNQQTIQYGRQ